MSTMAQYLAFSIPRDQLIDGMGPNLYWDVSINNRGSVAFTGGKRGVCNFPANSDDGVFLDDGEATTTIALVGVPAISAYFWPTHLSTRRAK